MEPATHHPASTAQRTSPVDKAGEVGEEPGATSQGPATSTSDGDLGVKTIPDKTQTRKLDEANSFEDILHASCGHGRWQNVLIFYMSLTWFTVPCFSMAIAFLGASPPFKCADGFDSNDTYNSLPHNATRCVQYDNSSAPCTRWVWSNALYETTVVTEWALVCDRKPLLSLLQVIFMLGGLVGALVAGQLADRIGRRPVFLPAMALIVAMAFASAAVTDYSLFVACRFFSGVAIAFMIGSQYVLVMELTTARVRGVLSAVTLFPFVIGSILVPVGSYCIRDRRLLQLAYAVPSLSLILNIWLMPESPRWLTQHGRQQEACSMLEQGCLWNGRAPPPRDALLKALSRLNLKDDDATTPTEQLQRLLEQLLQLVRTPRMRRYVLIGILAFFVASASFFGITFDSTQLSDDPHLTGVLLALMDIPALFYFIPIEWWGRRRTVSGFFLLVAIAMFLSAFLRHKSALLALGLIGKFAISMSFNTLFAFSPEYLPTSLRAAGFGACQVGLRLGACVSPFVVDLVSGLNPSAPSLVFGGLSLVTGLATMLLPETKGMKMPATVQDVEDGLVPETVPTPTRQRKVPEAVPETGSASAMRPGRLGQVYNVNESFME